MALSRFPAGVYKHRFHSGHNMTHIRRAFTAYSAAPQGTADIFSLVARFAAPCPPFASAYLPALCQQSGCNCEISEPTLRTCITCTGDLYYCWEHSSHSTSSPYTSRECMWCSAMFKEMDFFNIRRMRVIKYRYPYQDSTDSDDDDHNPPQYRYRRPARVTPRTMNAL